MQPPIYTSFTSKEQYFIHSENITTEKELDDLIASYQTNEQNFLFRGINNAAYKLYSSAQVQWMLSDAFKSLKKEDYDQFICWMIANVSTNSRVLKYIQDHNIQYNELFILALMQHFGMPSPMLDFSHSIESSLFFAYDNCDRTLSPSKDNLTDFVSLYVISKRIDWIKCSVQEVMRTSSVRLNDMLANDDMYRAGGVSTVGVEKEYRTLPYCKIKDWTFVPVDDNPNNPIRISIPILNFSCEYQIINDRILSQQGMFIANNSVDIPLVELMNDLCKDKYFACYNIHKDLLDYLKLNYLDTHRPAPLNHANVYCEDNIEVQELDSELTILKNNAIEYLRMIIESKEPKHITTP